MCKSFWVSRRRFVESEYAPSYAGLFAELESEAFRCRKVCGEQTWNCDSFVAKLANGKRC